MIILSQEAIEEFKQIWKKEFREEINNEKANEEGSRLIRLIKAVYKPVPKTELANK